METLMVVDICWLCPQYCSFDDCWFTSLPSDISREHISHWRHVLQENGNEPVQGLPTPEKSLRVDPPLQPAWDQHVFSALVETWVKVGTRGLPARITHPKKVKGNQSQSQSNSIYPELQENLQSKIISTIPALQKGPLLINILTCQPKRRTQRWIWIEELAIQICTHVRSEAMRKLWLAQLPIPSLPYCRYRNYQPSIRLATHTVQKQLHP